MTAILLDKYVRVILKLNLWLTTAIVGVTAFLLISSIFVEYTPRSEYLLGLSIAQPGVVRGTEFFETGEIFYFLFLLLPRAICIIFLSICFSRSEYSRYKPSLVLSLVVLGLGIILKFDYLYLSGAILLSVYMTSFEIRKGIGGPIFFLTFLAAYIGFAYVTSMPRGILLLCLIPFFAVGMKLPRYYAAIVIPLILLLIPISTFIKFGEWDPELLLNLLNRIGAQVQYTTYAVFGPNYFPMNKPVWHQFLESLPIIRQYFTSIDETDIFWTISGGYIGGFAVSPELRSLLYWSGSYISFIDVSFMYAIISVMSILIWRISKYHAWYSVICLPMISQMDSINSFSLYLQAVLICGTVQYFSDVIGVRRNNRGNREQNSNNFRLNSRQTTASQNQPLI